MRDWMTIAIALLGGLAVALVSFLILQPAPDDSSGTVEVTENEVETPDTDTRTATTTSRDQPESPPAETDPSETDPKEASSTEAESNAEAKNTANESGETDTPRNAAEASGEEWSESAERRKVPRLLFFSIPT